MKAGDTDEGVYTVGFIDDEFLMVRNTKRGGWEMPGGHVRIGETRRNAAEREYLEESGYRIEIIAERDIGHCWVFAGIIVPDTKISCEMDSRLFSELPDELSFSREEYEFVIPWARSELEKRGNRADFGGL